MNTEITTERSEPRVMLALIALATGLPAPEVISLHADLGILALTFPRLADGQAWSTFLGGGTDTYINTDGHRYLRHGVIWWHGWTVNVHAYEPVQPVEPDHVLDADTITRLTAIAAGPPADQPSTELDEDQADDECGFCGRPGAAPYCLHPLTPGTVCCADVVAAEQADQAGKTPLRGR